MAADNELTIQNWHHVLFSFDMANAAKPLFISTAYGNAVIFPYIDDTFENCGQPITIGADMLGTNLHEIDLADYWMDFGTFIDLSLESNRRKFSTADGLPMYLGPDGSIPTGSARIFS